MPPLSGTVVIEMAGLAPAPFAGLILADFGATVLRIDRAGEGANMDVLSRRKQSVALDLKQAASIHVLRQLARQADILLDPYRPGIMEKLGVGPDELHKENPRLIYARLSGFGQTGSASHAAGHDINYLAIAGLLSMLGRQGQAPSFPINIVADFAGGGLMCVMGILMAMLDRTKSGKGQVVDASLTAGTSYLTTFPYLMQRYGLLWEGERGTNTLDGGAHFYEVYKTKDDRYMAVGALEPQFYEQVLKGLGLESAKDLPLQHDRTSWPTMKARFAAIFATRTQSEWTRIFDGKDACVTPVLSYQESIPDEDIPPTSSRSWPRQACPPQPAPVLSRTPAAPAIEPENPFLQPGTHSIEVLSQFGFSAGAIQDLLKMGALQDPSFVSRL